MNGETDYAKQKLDKVNKALQEYEQGCGVPKYAPRNEAERFINMKHDEIKKLLPDELGEGAVILGQFSYHLQQTYNEEIARVTWAEDEVKRTIAGYVNQYQGSSYEERKLLAIKESEYASKVDAIRGWAKARADRIGYLSSKVEFLARMFGELQQSKRRQYNGNNQQNSGTG
jgi:hypothetical protein